jgi:hypothetical protein
MSILKRIFGGRSLEWNPADLPQARNNKRLQGLIGKWIDQGDHESAVKEYAEWEAIMDQKTRSALLVQITEKVEESMGWGWKSILPFALADNSHAIVSTAAMNLAVVIPADPEDELNGLNFVSGIAASLGSSSTRAGSLLSGLLLLGDVRACTLVMKSWLELEQEPRYVIASARSGIASRAHAIALLTWLEHEKDEVVYGALAGTLGSIPRLAEQTGIIDIERALPVYSDQDPIKLIGRYQVSEFGEGIRERLEKLANSETGDRVMPLVLQAWFGDSDPDELIIDTEDVELRAQKYCSGEIELDLKGDRFVDTQGMWMAENHTCQAAMSLMMVDKNSWNPAWFTMVRECAILGVETWDLEIWGSFGFQSGLMYTIVIEGANEVPEEAMNISKMLTADLRKEGFPVTYSTAAIQSVFKALHESLGMKYDADQGPIQAVACSHKGMIMGMANASLLTDLQKQKYIDSIDDRSLCEQLIIKSALAAKKAKTTAELMVSSIIRGCTYKYDGYPLELEFFASYFQEAEQEGNLSLNSPVISWIKDADAYSKAICRIKPQAVQSILEEHREGVEASIRLFKNLLDAVPDGDEVETCKYYWENRLGNGCFNEITPTVVDQILILVDLIVWRNILAENPS